MDLSESKSHSFIVKIWLEETAEQGHRATWRGHITHVPGGERRYVQDLDRIIAFIGPYLERMGVSLGLGWRLREWRMRCKQRLKRKHG